ncbi:MAG TPA: Gfo/Idh/MocA family oxidoreductase, partial [Candidatus Hydrogenedentes bacterium]|nr:Gfo/Idh/MocA family oxidoreductase [Candidatus Hydrogenedentota bacterium]
GRRVYGANERARLGFIGVANRGGQLITATRPHEDAEIVAVCDVYRPAMEQWREKLPGAVDLYGDYRRLLERDDIDGVVIATPDHWHALQTVDACDAGKDVFIEKPLSMTVHEGRRMVEAARRNKRIVQVGLQRRSGEMFHELAEFLKGGSIGKVTVAHCHRITNMTPDGMGRAQPSEPPEGLDWDMWLGPRAYRPYQDNITPYKFRWWKEYSSQIGNWGVHYFDLIRWLLGEDAPVSVVALGGQYAVDDDRTIPDTMQAVFEFASGRLLVFSQYEANGAPVFAVRGDIELRGTLGTLYAGDRGYQVVPERGGQFQDAAPRMEPVKTEARSPNADLTVLHMRNFLDCIKSRAKPNSDVEDGHRSTIFSHLGNIALETRSRIDWDPKTERITNHEATNALLHYEYRAPWELR